MIINEVLSYLPKQPREAEHFGRVLDTVEELIVKNLYVNGELSGNNLSKLIKIPVQIANRVLKLLADEELITVIGGAKTGLDLGGDFTYGLYAKGIEKARNLLE